MNGILIKIEKGMVQSVSASPGLKNVKVIVADYDTDGAEGEYLVHDSEGRLCDVSEYKTDETDEIEGSPYQEFET